MRFSPRAVLFLSLAATACGNSVDGGGGKDAVLSGTFVGPVAGLHFATPSQVGTTDASGAFAYKAGETVTFTLGGVTLGSVLAAPQISPFELFGIAPPTTQVSLVTNLNNFAVDGFDAALNVTVFLAALDNDHDPSNGITLDGWNDKLASDSLRFDTSWRLFLAGHFGTIAIANNIVTTQKTSFAAPIAQLYRTLGITVGTSFATHQSYVEGPGPGQSTSYTYDAQHNQLTSSSDYDNDGDIEDITTSTFAPNGAIVSTKDELDADSDGTRELSSQAMRTLSATGDTTREVDTNYRNGGEVSTAIQTYDGAHRRLSLHVDSDSLGDGSVESTTDETYAYDADGNLTGTVTELRIGGVLTETITTTATFDVRGNQLSSETHDQTTTLIRSRTTATYDTNAVILTVSSITDSGDGTPVTARLDSTTTTSPTGKTLTSDRRTDSDGDGTPNRRTFTTYTYDGNDRALTYKFEVDNDANGVIDSRQLQTYAYEGTTQTSTFTNDRDANGSVDASAITIDVYDADGNRLTSTQTNDTDNDGTPDTTSVISYTYERVADGVFFIVRDAAF